MQIQILGGMSPKSIPRNPKPKVAVSSQKRLRLEEWMEIRGVTPETLADEIDTTEASISRWCAGRRVPTKSYMTKLEAYFEVPPGGLYVNPADASERSLLAGLDNDQKDSILKFIAFTRGQK